MINFLFLKASTELEELSRKLGYEKTLFLESDFVEVHGSQKEILTQIRRAKQQKKITVAKPISEGELRFLLEKTAIDLVYGLEGLHEKDSLYFPRGGLDQVLCALARGKTIGFSFSNLLNGADRPRLLQRMMFNMELCRKYNVKSLLSTFASNMMDMRATKDLEAVWRVLRKK